MADTIRYASVPAKTLASDLSSSGAVIKLTEIKDWNGTDLTSTQFSTYIPATLINDARTKVEFVLLTASTIGVATTTGITIYKRGLKYYAEGDTTDTDEVTANKLDWTAGETKLLLGTNPPNMYGKFASRENDETITGTWTFEESVTPRVDSEHTYGSGEEEYLATKRYADSLAIAGAPDASETQKGIVEQATLTEARAGAASGGTTAPLFVDAADAAFCRQEHITKSYQYGETITAGEVVYLKTTDSKWYLASAASAATADGTFGIAYETGASAAYGIIYLIGSNVSGVAGLTAGWVYLSDTPGALSATAGTYKKVLGYAPDATHLFFLPGLRIEEVSGTNAATTTANINEAMTFFNTTDITGAEAETLSDGSNADSLHIHSYNKRLTTFTTDVTTATADETTVLSVAVPANTLSTINGIKGRVYISDWDSGGTNTLTMKLKYGGTTLVTAVTSSAGAATNKTGWVDFCLLSDGNIAKQDGSIVMNTYESAGTLHYAACGVGVATEDSSGALNLVLTAQIGVATSGSITFAMGYAEIIR